MIWTTSSLFTSVSHVGLHTEAFFAWEQRKLSELLVERNVQHSQSEEFPLVSFTVENGVTPKVSVK